MVRKAKADDLPAILNIYAAARAIMARNGNPTQWGDAYPYPDIVEEDIALGRLYVVCDEEDKPRGVFAFILGEEPSYAEIDGAWRSDKPYGTIHRVAGDGSRKGIFSQCLRFCRSVTGELRIDTHPNNRIMQHVLEKHGFVRCGMINLDRSDGDGRRIAYQLEERS